MRASWSRDAGAPSLPLAGAMAAGILAAVVFAVPPGRAAGTALILAALAGLAFARPGSGVRALLPPAARRPGCRGAVRARPCAGGGSGRRRRSPRGHRSPRRAVDRERLAFSDAARRRNGLGGRALDTSRVGAAPHGRGTAGPLRRRRARGPRAPTPHAAVAGGGRPGA